jgi:hypothetical protein
VTFNLDLVTVRRLPLTVSAEGHVFAGDMRVAQVVFHDGDLFIRFRDRNKWRSLERGTNVVEFSLWDLLQALKVDVPDSSFVLDTD